jgi:hypothetical protein
MSVCYRFRAVLTSGPGQRVGQQEAARAFWPLAVTAPAAPARTRTGAPQASRALRRVQRVQSDRQGANTRAAIHKAHTKEKLLRSVAKQFGVGVETVRRCITYK